MKLEKLNPGAKVYSVRKYTMGNTTMSSIGVYDVDVVSVNHENRTVVASCNGNTPATYREHIWSKWRVKKPRLVKSTFGSYRLAKRGE